MENICKINGIFFKDLSQLENVYSNPSYFRDEIHLCKTRAELYSYQVAELISKNY